jgi:CRISPR-associated protein Csm4
MERRIYKLTFKGSVHFGNTSLEDAEFTLHADTVFSALLIEALKIGGAEKLEQVKTLASTDCLYISDAMPFLGEQYFIPKPIFQILPDGSARKDDDSVMKKKFKKVKFIPIEKLEDYFRGKADPDELGGAGRFGSAALHTKVNIRGEGDPYQVGVFQFVENAGLYLIASGTDESLGIVEELLYGLSAAGIGGKRGSGYGRFELSKENDAQTLAIFNERLKDGFQRYVSLCPALPREDELPEVMKDACYRIEKRSGFVYSEDYAPESVRKNDLYVFAAASVFSKTFKGDIYDVSSGGNHPVYRYAKPLFVGVKI